MRWLKREGTAKGASASKSGGKAAGKSARGKTARKRPAPRWVRYAGRSACAVLIFGVALGGPTWLWQSGWVADTAETVFDGIAEQMADAGLRVDQIYLQGRTNESAAAINRALDVRRGAPLLTVDLDAARQRIEDLQWVRVASVEREFPNAIRVRIVERRPLALWQRGKKLVLVDDQGVVIADRNPGRFPHLLVVVGDDAPSHADALLTILSREPALKKRVDAAVRIGERRWNIRMDNGVYVRLPESEALEAWQRFARLERQHGLLKQDLVSIDLRIPDQLIVRTRAGRPAIEQKVRHRKGKDT